MRSWVTLAALLSSACGASPGSCDPPLALEVRVDGASAVDVRAIASREIGELPRGLRARLHVEDRATRARQLAWQAYLDAGHALARVSEPELELSADRSRVLVRFQVHEGPIFQFGALSILDDRADLDGELSGSEEALSQIHSGDRFGRSPLLNVGNVLLDACREVGHGGCEVVPDATIDEARARVDVVFRVVRGPRCIIDEVDALDEVDDTVLVDAALTAIPLGAPYRGSIIDRVQREVEAAHSGRRVSITIVDDGAATEAHCILRVRLLAP